MNQRQVRFAVTLTFSNNGVLDREVIESAVREALDNEFDAEVEDDRAALIGLDVTPI